MLDIGSTELLMIVIVAVVVIGPKDMPLAMRTAGRWIGKMRKITGHFRAGIDAMVREAELEEMERKWREQNEAIMKSAPQLPTAEEMQPPAKAAETLDGAPAASGDALASQPAPAALPEPAEAPVQNELNLAPATDPARPAS